MVFLDVFPKIKILFHSRKAKMQVSLQGWLGTGKVKYAHGAVADISLFCSTCVQWHRGHRGPTCEVPVFPAATYTRPGKGRENGQARCGSVRIAHVPSTFNVSSTPCTAGSSDCFASGFFSDPVEYAKFASFLYCICSYVFCMNNPCLIKHCI